MTTTAIPSLDVNDFKANIQDFDAMANGTGVYTDRFGKERLTLDAFMSANGFEVPVAFASGISVSRTTQTVTYEGNTYHALPSALPFTTTGTFNSAQWALLRQNADNVTSATLTITGFAASALLDGAWIHFAGRDTVGDGGGGYLRFIAGSTITADGGTVYAVTGGRLVREDLSQGVRPEWFGAKGKNTGNDAPAINLAFSAIAKGGKIAFTQGAVYRTTEPIIVPPSLAGAVIEGNGATINAQHNGDGIVSVATNENYSRNKFYNLTVIGPNASYPANAAELAGTSLGAGLRMGRNDTSNTVAGYLSSFHNCTFRNFKHGVYLQAALLVNFFGGSAVFNQYGIYVDGGQTNSNCFFGTVIRENRIAGVCSSGRTGGSLTSATNNKFFGCEIESNIPYNAETGGYPSTFDSSGIGVGVHLSNSYDWIFEGTYSENHNYGVWLGSGSDDNKFVNCRFDEGGVGLFRKDGVMLYGDYVSNNTFDKCKIVASNSVDGNVTITSVNGTGSNKFIDCTGFVFEKAKLAAQPYISNNTKTQGSVNGTHFGALVVPPQGIISNPQPGTAQGEISGIGTSTATLNAFGIGEAMLGSSITAPTTITAINGMVPGQLLVLSNYQIAHPVTVKSSTDGTSGIVLKNRTNATLSNYGDAITLYCISVGRVVEVGRNLNDNHGTWTPSFIRSGGSTPAQTSTGTWVREGKKVTLWFDVTFTSGPLKDFYYSTTSPFGHRNPTASVGTVSSKSSEMFDVQALSSGVLRCYVTSSVDGFSGVATIMLP